MIRELKEENARLLELIQTGATATHLDAKTHSQVCWKSLEITGANKSLRWRLRYAHFIKSLASERTKQEIVTLKYYHAFNFGWFGTEESPVIF